MPTRSLAWLPRPGAAPPGAVLASLLLLSLPLPAAPALADDAPRFDASCLSDPRSCLPDDRASLEAEPTPAPTASEPAPRDFVDPPPPDPWTEAAPVGGGLDRTQCVERSVRAGNGLDESQRVCAAVFPDPEAPGTE